MRAPRTAIVSALALLFALPALAGCFGAEETPVTQIKATASDVTFSLGWAYDGTGITKIDGNATLDVDDVANTGTLTATLLLGDNETYTVQFNSFKEAPEKLFQNGGIAFNLLEHGASGNGDTAVPQLHAIAAGWGDATVTKNGNAYPDPISGNPTWVAHFMYTDTGIRGADGRMLTADKAGVYSPDAPANGFSEAGDQELWLVLRTAPPAGALPNVTASASDTIMNPTPAYEKSFPITVPEPGVAIPLNIALRSASAVPAYQGSMTFTLLDPAGVEVGKTTLAPGPTGGPVASTLEVPAKAGTYTLGVKGTNVANLAWTAEGAGTMPSEVVMVFLFENVTLV